MYLQFEGFLPLQHQNPRPFSFPLGFTRGFGKTGRLCPSKGRRNKDGAPAWEEKLAIPSSDTGDAGKNPDPSLRSG